MSDVKLSQEELTGKNHILVEGLISQGSHLIGKSLTELNFRKRYESFVLAIKRQTASSSYKPATLENGISVMVPPFISSGDKIILDTRTLEYIKKVK